MNFYFCGLIFILFLKILAPKGQKSVDHLPSFEIFEIKTKLHLLRLKFLAWVLGLEFPKAILKTVLFLGQI